MASHRVWTDTVRRPTRVLFDSSFLIAIMEHPTTWREDILQELGRFEPVVIRPVREELERLSSGSGRSARYASLALALVEREGFCLEESRGDGRADDELVSLSMEGGTVVATLDRDLMLQLKASRVPVLSLRGGRVYV